MAAMKAPVTAGIILALLLFGHTAHAADAIHVAASSVGYAQRLADLINQYRQRHGLGPLSEVADLSSLAAEHTSRMADQHHLSHDGFRDRFDRTHAKICVENVWWNFPYPEAQLEGWRASPGHHRNLLEPKVTQMGVAVSRSYVTFFACS